MEAQSISRKPGVRPPSSSNKAEGNEKRLDRRICPILSMVSVLFVQILVTSNSCYRMVSRELFTAVVISNFNVGAQGNRGEGRAVPAGTPTQ